RAHVSYLVDVLERAEFDSLLYLSSTRLYAGLDHAGEDATLKVNSGIEGDLYNLSKLTGEAACLACASNQVRVVRLSNVYGAGMGRDNFLGSLIEDATTRGRIVTETALESAKDYVWLEDVVPLLASIAVSGRHRLYNLASGHNVTNAEIIRKLEQFTGC